MRERMSEREDHLSKASAFVAKRTREGKAARNKGVESRGARSPPLRLAREYEYTSVRNTCHRDARATLKTSSKLLLDTLALQAHAIAGSTNHYDSL